MGQVQSIAGGGARVRPPPGIFLQSPAWVHCQKVAVGSERSYSRPMAFQDDQSNEQMVTVEQSMFGTRLPRPTGVRRHVVVVVAISVVALVLAVLLALQMQPTKPSTAAPASADP